MLTVVVYVKFCDTKDGSIYLYSRFTSELTYSKTKPMETKHWEYENM